MNSSVKTSKLIKRLRKSLFTTTTSISPEQEQPEPNEKPSYSNYENHSISLKESFFTYSQEIKKEPMLDSRSQNSMHSCSSITSLKFSNVDLPGLPSFRVDGPLESKLRALLPSELYLQLNLCMGHQEYFPGDATSNNTMPWPDSCQLELQYDYKDNNKILRAATLNGIIYVLSSIDFNDQELLDDFLRTYHYFITSHDLLRMIFSHYVNCALNPNHKHNVVTQLNLLGLLKKWIHNYHAVLSSSKEFYHFAQLVLVFITIVESNRSQFISSILNDLLAYEHPNQTSVQLEGILNQHQNLPTTFEQTFPKDFIDINAKVLAQQLTLIEQRIFCSIQPEEIYHQAWNDKQNRSKTSPNLWTLIQIFNRTASYVASVTKQSVVAFSHFVSVAYYCLKYHNYNSAFELLAGLSMSRVLETSRKGLSSRTKQRYQKLATALSTKENYKAYRNLLRQIAPSHPTIPFVGVALTDIVFSENGNPTHFMHDSKLPKTSNPWHFPSLATPYVNIYKIRLMSSLMTQLLSYQQVAYQFEEVTKVQECIIYHILTAPVDS